MADAAKAARGSFGDIKSGASGMASDVSGSMRQAREGVMLLGEEFGVHLPRALTTFIAELGPMAGIIEAAFPFLAVAALAGILIEHLQKLHEAGVKLTTDQMAFGTTAQNAFNDLDKKLLEAGITADDLNNNHLDALHKKLQLIDMQSMEELDHTFGILQKAADAVFKDLDSHWYTFGIGSKGAKNAMDQFQAQYQGMLAQGRSKDASDLLAGTRNSAEAILADMKLMQQGVTPTGDNAKDQAAYNQGVAAHNALKAAGVGWSDKEVESQQTLVNTLNNQIVAQGKIADLTHLDKSNATKTYDNGESAKRAAMAREVAESKQRLAEQGLAAERATADAALTVQRASLEQRLASDIAFAGKERDIKAAANKAEIAALDKSGKDYNQQLKALQDAALGITAEYNTKVTELKSKALVAENARDIQLMEQSEQLKIDAQKEGTAARMAAIDSAIAEEQAKGLESTEHFQDLLRQRKAEAIREADVEKEAVLKSLESQETAIQKAAEAHVKQSNQKIQAQQGGGSDNVKQIAMEKLQEQQSYEIKRQALQEQLALYHKYGEDQLKAAQDVAAQLKQLEDDHKAAMAQSLTQMAMANRQEYASMATTAGQSLMQIALGHQSLAATVQKFAQEGVEHVMAAIFEEMVGQKSLQMARAESAAAGAYTALSSVPIVGPVLAGVAAASVFAGAMAFESGGIVPGVGKGDIVPAMLTPGEGIVPGSVMDGLRDMARNGGMQAGPTIHQHQHITYHVNTIDGDGMQAALEKNSEVVQQHMTNSLKRMNR